MEELVQLGVFSKFLHSEVNLLKQHIIVQDQDEENNKLYW